MMKPILILGLLLAAPAASEKVKPPRAEELVRLRDTVKDLEGLAAEHQERLRVHKAEIDGLRREVTMLESRMIMLEAKIANGGPDHPDRNN